MPGGNFAGAVGGGLALAALAALGIFLALADPRGGEPYAIAVIPPPGPSNRSSDASGPVGSAAGNQPASPVARFQSAGVSPSTQTATDPLQTGSITHGPQDASAETGTMEKRRQSLSPDTRIAERPCWPE